MCIYELKFVKTLNQGLRIIWLDPPARESNKYKLLILDVQFKS